MATETTLLSNRRTFGIAMFLGGMVVGAAMMFLLLTKPQCPDYYRKKDGKCFFVTQSGGQEVWNPIPCPTHCTIQ